MRQHTSVTGEYCLPWEAIQHKMHYGATATYELHGRAFQSFWKVYQMMQNNGV